MAEKRIEDFLNAMLYITLIGFVIYGIYSSGNNKSFDNVCAAACSPARSITPVIDMKNQCLCDEGQGKWRFQDVK